MQKSFGKDGGGMIVRPKSACPKLYAKLNQYFAGRVNRAVNVAKPAKSFDGATIVAPPPPPNGEASSSKSLPADS
jgi:hypothetical protein